MYIYYLLEESCFLPEKKENIFVKTKNRFTCQNLGRGGGGGGGGGVGGGQWRENVDTRH